MQAPPKFIRKCPTTFSLAMQLIKRESWTVAIMYIDNIKSRLLRKALLSNLEKTRQSIEEYKGTQPQTSSAHQTRVHSRRSKILDFTREYIKSQLW